jgi:L-threonylcarbamoyladenylate synthase
MAQILQPTPAHLDQLAAVLSQGEIVAIPTETVYGLAGNALNPEAVAKIYEAKGRPARNPLIVHIGHSDQIGEIAFLPDVGSELIDHFWPGPLTLVLPKTKAVPDSVTAGLDSVAVRMPDHPVFQKLASRCSFPLAAPSANPFGYVSPTKAEHVESQMGDVLEWILDGGTCRRGIESTILSLIDPDNPEILRHGSISVDRLSTFLGQQILEKNRVDEGKGLISPGLMKRHYSPKTTVQLFEGPPPALDSNSAIVFLGKASKEFANPFSLSTDGNLEAVARTLYDTLHQLDKKGFQSIYLELPPASGLGLAIRDRMKRAASKG